MKLVFALAASLLFGCERGRSPMFELHIDVSVLSDPGIPLAGVAVHINGETIGSTDADGWVGANTWVNPGELVEVTHQCPANFVPASGSRAFRIRQYVDDRDDLRVSLNLLCRPERRLAVFVVRASNAGPVDVFIDSEWAVTTDAKGVAHASRKGAPGSEFLLELVPQNSRLRPTKTARLFVLPDTDEIFVVDQLYRVWREAKHSPHGKRRIRRIE